MEKIDKIKNVLQAENDRLANELKRVQAAIAALDGLGKNGSLTASRRGKRKMSAAARARIGAAQRARWAKWKAKQH